MTRDELIDAGLSVWPKGTRTQRDVVALILDVVEPLIRADERAKPCMDARRLRGLRAKVEALRDEAMDNHWADAIIAYQTLLALFDGADP